MKTTFAILATLVLVLLLISGCADEDGRLFFKDSRYSSSANSQVYTLEEVRQNKTLNTQFSQYYNHGVLCVCPDGTPVDCQGFVNSGEVPVTDTTTGGNGAGAGSGSGSGGNTGSGGSGSGSGSGSAGGGLR